MTRSFIVGLSLGALALGGCATLKGIAGDAETVAGDVEGAVDEASNMTASCSEVDFGQGDKAKNVEAFMGAVDDFTATAEQVEGQLVATCRKIGEAYDIPAERMKPEGGQSELEATCGLVARWLQWEAGVLSQASGGELEIAIEPPQCRLPDGALSSCMSACNPSFDAASLEACAQGEAEASLDGSALVAFAAGQCGGDAQGGLGGLAGGLPKLDATCSLSCAVEMGARAVCTPGRSRVRLGAGAQVHPQVRERVERLDYVVYNAWPVIQGAVAKLESLKESGAAMAASASVLPQAVKGMDVNATRCAATAAAKVPGAVKELGGSVKVAGSLSASVK